MGTHTTVTTWTDTFGRWHARVTATGSILTSHTGAVAHAAIAAEIRLRDDKANLNRMVVKHYQPSTSRNGEYETEFVEKWSGESSVDQIPAR